MQVPGMRLVRSRLLTLPGWGRRATCACLALVALALGPGAGPLPAQSLMGDDETALLRFQDSLRRVNDTVDLGELERRLIRRAARAVSDPALHLRLGFLALRLGELGQTAHFNDAASEFLWTTRLRPDAPLGWYGLGLSEFALGRAQAEASRRVAVGLLARDAADRAVVAFARSAEVDPGFAHRLYALAVRSVHEREPTRARLALEALRRTARGTTASLDVRLKLALGRTEREFGDLTLALLAFDQAVDDLGPERPGLPLLEVARTRFLLGRRDGAVPYFLGARSDDSAAVAQYRSDLATIASPAELARFDGARGEGRATFLARFWRERDLAEFREPGERLVEHYRRLYEARRRFPLRVPPRVWDDRTWIALNEGPRVDERGEIFIRHGEPDDRASLQTLGVEPNESWRYARGGQDLILHFVARQDPENFRLIESLFDIVDVRNGTTVARGLANRRDDSPRGGSTHWTTDELLRSRATLGSVYGTRAGGGGSGPGGADLQLAERLVGRSSMVQARGTDSFRRRFESDLDARAQVLVAHGATEAGAPGRVVVAFAVPARAMEPVQGTPAFQYPLRVRLLLSDLDGEPALLRDTTVTIGTSRILPPNRVARGAVRLPVPPGRYVARLLLEQGDRVGTSFAPTVVEVSRVGHDSLSAGDVLLRSLRGRGGEIAVDAPIDDSLLVSPTGAFAPGERIGVSLLLAAERPWTSLEARLVLIRQGEDARVELNRVITEPGMARSARLDHVLDLGRVRPGEYSLELTVRTPDGRLVRRWRDLVVAPR